MGAFRRVRAHWRGVGLGNSRPRNADPLPDQHHPSDGAVFLVHHRIRIDARLRRTQGVRKRIIELLWRDSACHRIARGAALSHSTRVGHQSVLRDRSLPASAIRGRLIRSFVQSGGRTRKVDEGRQAEQCGARRAKRERTRFTELSSGYNRVIVRFYIAVLCLLATVAVLPAQAPTGANAWQTSETLGAIDLSSLSPVQKRAVLKLVREQDCSCLCGMNVAECIAKDPNCAYSKQLAAIAIQGVKDGKSLVEISMVMDSSPKAHRPKLLEDSVSIPVDGSPVKGPVDARIAIVEFSDFECPYCSLAV